MPSIRKGLGNLHCQAQPIKSGLRVLTPEIKTAKNEVYISTPTCRQHCCKNVDHSDTHATPDPPWVHPENFTDSRLDLSMQDGTSWVCLVIFKHELHDPASTPWIAAYIANGGSKVKTGGALVAIGLLEKVNEPIPLFTIGLIWRNRHQCNNDTKQALRACTDTVSYGDLYCTGVESARVGLG